jgi:hypothetical protein
MDRTTRLNQLSNKRGALNRQEMYDLIHYTAEQLVEWGVAAKYTNALYAVRDGVKTPHKKHLQRAYAIIEEGLRDLGTKSTELSQVIASRYKLRNSPRGVSIIDLVQSMVSATTPPAWTPASLSNLKAWVNTRTTDNKTLSGTFSEVMTGWTSNDSNGYTFIGYNEPLRNVAGKGIVLFGTRYFSQASTTDLKILHDGSAYDLCFNYTPLEDIATTGGAGISIHPIIHSAASSAAVGVQISYNNTTASGCTNALVFTVTRGVAGQSPFNLIANNMFTKGVTTHVRIKCTGTTATIYKNGTQVATATRSYVQSTAAAGLNLLFGRYASTSDYNPGAVIGDILITDGNLTDEDAAKVYTYSSSLGAFGTTDTADFHFFWGQSNMQSSDATSANLAYRAAFDSYLLNNPNNTQLFVVNSRFVKYEWDVSVSSGTRFGPDMKFAYDRAQTKPGKTFIVKYAVGGTALKLNGTTPDWNTGSTVTELAGQSTLAIKNGLLVLKYALDRDVTIRSFDQRQGETDALFVDGNVNYKADLTALIKKWIDQIEALGYSTAKLRVVISLISHPLYSPARPFMGDIDAAIISMCNNWATDNPTYAAKVAGFHTIDCSDLVFSSDTTHFVSSQIEVMGTRFTTALSPYANE